MITEFGIGCSHTVNLGDFNSIKVDAWVKVALMDEEELEKAKASAQVELRRLLEETYRAQAKQKAAT